MAPEHGLVRQGPRLQPGPRGRAGQAGRVPDGGVEHEVHEHVNRAWSGVDLLLFSAFAPLDDAMIMAAGRASVWTSWMVDLLVAHWWLLRTRRRTPVPAA